MSQRQTTFQFNKVMNVENGNKALLLLIYIVVVGRLMSDEWCL